MADISITAANVKPGEATTKLTRVLYGATITQGQSVYSDLTDSNKYKPADADAAASALAGGVAMTPGVSGDYGFIATEGLVNMGATLAVGQTYAVSTNAGGVCPLSDLASGDFVRILGQATTAALLDLFPCGGEVAKA
jgi:hypothetical protein